MMTQADRREGEAVLIAVATNRHEPAATPDDEPALSRLAARWPVKVETIPWDAPAQWERYAAVLIRSTWDCLPAGTFLLMEAELIEPALFFAFDDGAADRFADAVVRRLSLVHGGRC